MKSWMKKLSILDKIDYFTIVVHMFAVLLHLGKETADILNISWFLSSLGWKERLCPSYEFIKITN